MHTACHVDSRTVQDASGLQAFVCQHSSESLEVFWELLTAENLLKPEGTAKWKSATPGEKSLSIILQLEKPSEIHQIDVGNEGSAFVEVLVGKAAQKEEEFQVIMVASSFMNPQESRSGTNMTRVRIFHADQLSQAVKSDRWDRLKIICTQPFNRTSTYGLSFIKIHSPPSKDGSGAAPETPESQKKIGAFTLKSEEDDAIQTGTLFMKKKTEPSPSLTGAAAARQASRFVTESSSSPGSSNSTPVRPKPSSSVTPKVTPNSSKKRPVESDEETSDSERPKPKIKRSATEGSTSSTSSERHSIKRSSTEPARQSSSSQFSTLMKKVVFVLSGYQNPERGRIRDEALEMGGTYRQDWGQGCTHLICAFPNTPKYQQVQGKGRIVAADWIKRSYKKKELLPWRKYRVGKAKTPPGSSESEAEDEQISSQPSQSRTPSQARTPQSKTPFQSKTPSQSKTPVRTDRERETEKEKDREASKKKTTSYTGKGVQFNDSDSGEDTEDEIDRVRAQQKKVATNASSSTAAAAAAADAEDVDPYDIPTDDEETNGKDSSNGKHDDDDDTDDDGDLPPLPDYFKQKHFFLHGKFSHSDRRTMVRYITAYNGLLEDYMSETVKYVITDSKWDDTFDEAVSENPDIVFVKPNWIQNVHEKKKFVPYQKFVIVPE